jgi:hypothetical protein
MEELIKELKEIFTFKDCTREGDIVLIAARKPPMLVYALVIAITRDGSKRDEWWHVALQLLTIPPQAVVWTLRESQFTGKEIFTMAGEERFVKAIHFAVARKAPSENSHPGEGKGKPGPLRVIK